MISILVTAHREPGTIGPALEALLQSSQKITTDTFEIVVICPDDETAQAAQVYPSVQVLRDPARGKPAALNLGLEQAQGDIIVMTDGDVQVGPEALAALIAPFANPSTGAVSGRPVSQSPRSSMLGYWSHLLTDAGAHVERLERERDGRFFVCSGYLYAIRGGLVTHIPEDVLAEDAVISHLIGQQGYRTRYAPSAEVYVRYPNTYADWLKQKVRSAGGYAQPVIANSPLRMRSFWQEALGGTMRAVRYARKGREFLWTLLLLGARLHLWLLIWWNVRVRRQPLEKLWQRVESTK